MSKRKSKKSRRGRGEGALFFSESKNCWIGRAVVGVKPNGSPRLKEVTAKTQGEVVEKIKKAEEAARQFVPVDDGKMTVGKLLDLWLESHKPDVQLTTWESYERCCRLHLKHESIGLGGIKLVDLRPMHVDQFFSQLQRGGVSGGNAKKVSEVLSSALEYAVRVELIKTNPAASIIKPVAGITEIVPFTQDEIARILNAALGHRLEAFFALAIASGARQGELLGLGWDHVHFTDNTIHIQRTLTVVRGGFLLKGCPKSERGNRIVELPRFAMDALAEHRKRMLAEGHASAPVVFCTRTGNYITRSSLVNEVYPPLLKDAKVPYRKFHTFRHTHISQLLHAGEPVVDVARRVGDRPEVILKTYAKYLPGNADRTTRLLDQLYG